jgi:hypothetical protein
VSACRKTHWTYTAGNTCFLRPVLWGINTSLPQGTVLAEIIAALVESSGPTAGHIPAPEREAMHIDRGTKLLLCALIFVLGVLVLRPFFASEATSQPMRQNFEHVRYLGGFGSGIGASILLLDVRNGDIWSYNLIDPRATYVGQLTELGQPLLQSRWP